MKLSRRSALAILGAPAAFQVAAQTSTNANQEPDARQAATRSQRMQWWHDAKFGMFIHFGLYSVYGHHEWAMENEAIPVSQYEKLAAQFNPKPNASRDWARLAKRAGQKYMVMTTKHHEGFCLFNSKLTGYCAPKHAAGRDLVAEFVENVRAEGLTPGFYYSLMDWHHPDGAKCATDEAARRRFVDYIHGQIRELMTNYGKIGVLWYDVAWPLDPQGWESEKMNKMVFDLQPGIIVNNRNKLPGDFSTPEQTIRAESGGRAWESCMTMNQSWGYQISDDDWKTPKTIVRNLVTCARDGGNYLLNIGPRGDGSIPEPSVEILSSVGRWMDGNSESIYKTQPCGVRRSSYANFTRNGNTLYMHIHFWPGSEARISGLRTKVAAAKLLRSGQPVRVEQDEFATRLIGLPDTAPDDPVTTIALTCDGEPVQDTDFVRKNRQRDRV